MVFGFLLFITLGLVIGSFLSAYTYRLPRGISIAKGRSVCPNCKKKIAWYDNIPLLSYLLLGGKCRNCKRAISVRYPLIEISTALLFVATYFYFLKCLTLQVVFLKSNCFYINFLGPWALPYFLLIATILIAIFVIDLEYQIIPDEFVFFLFGITFLVILIFSAGDFYVRLLTAFFSGLFLLVLHLITRGKGMGLGDVKMALFGGLLFGFPQTLVWMFLSFIVGALVGLFLIIIGKAKFGKHIPFGPFLVVSFFITLIWGDVLIGSFFPML